MGEPELLPLVFVRNRNPLELVAVVADDVFLAIADDDEELIKCFPSRGTQILIRDSTNTQTMNISVVGSGYVGTTVAACLADLGHTVTNVDIDERVVTAINEGRSPIHEPGLDELLAAHGGDRLTATTDYGAVRGTDATFVALPTPSNDDGSVDLSIITQGMTSLGEALAEKSDPHIVVIKSTVIPGSTETKLEPALRAAGAGENVHVAVNPEFQREGSAVEDYLNPDKIVVGTDSEYVRETLDELFEPLVQAAKNDPAIVYTGRREAEMIKYANNAFLASKVSLINEIGNICKAYGVDAYEVADAIGLDNRIGEQFLRSGVGFGGSCFPKDTAALIAAGEAKGYDPSLLKAVVEVNDKQPKRLLQLAEEEIDVTGKRVAILGLAFKPGTDDVRNSRAIPLIEALQERGAKIVAYDPVATENMQAHFPDIKYASTAADALQNAHAALVVTDWDEFAALDEEFDAMATPLVVDGRRIIERRDGLIYRGLTW